MIERTTFQQASRINLVSPGFLDYCRRRHPYRNFSVFTNGIDAQFLNHGFCKPPSGQPRKIVYAGNIGLGQGIENIVPEVARRLGEGYEFRVIGDGGRRLALERRLRAIGVSNVTVAAPVNRDVLKREYQQADYLLLHLNNVPALDKVLPSKLFEYAATGKPILAGVRGYARQFIQDNVDGAAVFEPGNASAMVEALKALAPKHWTRDEFKRDFARDRIMDGMAADILSS
jgi:glycosyltransferase involved in cell wall biosynthesis